MAQNQLSLEDLLIEETPATSLVKKSVKKIFSPKELFEQGKNPTTKDEVSWKKVVWEVQRRERSKGNWINWFEACELYRRER